MADAERQDLDFDSQDLGMKGITEEERQEIEADLKQIVDQTIKPPALAREYSLPQRSGVFLPIMVWVVAAAVATGGYFYLQAQFETRENEITVEARSFFGAEAQLLSDIIRENERRLAEKDAEINQIQSQLALLNRERGQFEQNLQQQIAEREAELRAELEAELAAERARLAEEGISAQEIDQQISNLETQREEELATQVQTLQSNAQAELEALEQQLAAQEAALEQELIQSRQERDQISEEANERVAAVEARAQQVEAELGQEIQALEQAEQQALTQIEQLRAQRQSDQLLTDRILGSFAVILEDIQDGLTDQAIGGLNSLERLLLDQQAAGGDTQQVDTELALTSTLRGLVREVAVLRQNLTVRDLTTTTAETDELERARAAELIETAAQTAILAEQAREAGRFTEARTLYQQALSTIPSLETVYPGILDLEATRRSVALQSALSEAQALLADGAANAAVDRYLEGLRTIAATEDDPLIDVAQGIDTAVALTAEELLSLQEEIQTELQATIAARNQQITTLENQLATARSATNLANQQIAPLQEELAELAAGNRALQEELSVQRAAAAAAAQDATALRDQIEDLEGELTAARTRVTNLEQAQEESPAGSAESADAVQAIEALESAVAERETVIAGLREQIEGLRETRDATGATAQELEQEVSRLESELARERAALEEVEGLRSLYQRAVGQATTQLNTGQPEAARRTLLNVFQRPAATQLFPALATNLERAHRELIQQAEATSGGQARAGALTNVVTLAGEIQENIDAPREAASVQSYLRREPDLQNVAAELFEIVALANRQISAPEVDYRLLGSVSRITGNLIVVERLVTTPTEVGTSVELRRTPSLGQETPIGRGVVLEVSEERVLVSVEEIYDLDQPPQPRDIVYIRQE